MITRESILEKYKVNTVVADERQPPKQSDFDLSRLGFFTASEFYKLFTKQAKTAKNETSRGYVNRKATERITGMSIQEDISYVKSIQRGIELEPFLITAYEAKTNTKLLHHGNNQKRFEIKEFNTSALCDAISNDWERCIEGKCPNLDNHIDNIEFSHDLNWFIENRWDYYVQLQVQMWCGKFKSGDFVSYCDFEKLNDDMKCHIVNIKRDEVFIDKCKEVALVNIEILNKEIERRQKFFKATKLNPDHENIIHPCISDLAIAHHFR